MLKLIFKIFKIVDNNLQNKIYKTMIKLSSNSYNNKKKKIRMTKYIKKKIIKKIKS